MRSVQAISHACAFVLFCDDRSLLDGEANTSLTALNVMEEPCNIASALLP